MLQQYWDLDVSGRFVDRDMLMRFYWGLGIGHVYSHGDEDEDDDDDGRMDDGDENDTEEEEEQEEGSRENDDENMSDPGEAKEGNSGAGIELNLGGLGLNDQEDDPWYNSSEDEGEDSEDSEFLELQETF